MAGCLLPHLYANMFPAWFIDAKRKHTPVREWLHCCIAWFHTIPRTTQGWWAKDELRLNTNKKRVACNTCAGYIRTSSIFTEDAHIVASLAVLGTTKHDFISLPHSWNHLDLVATPTSLQHPATQFLYIPTHVGARPSMLPQRIEICLMPSQSKERWRGYDPKRG